MSNHYTSDDNPIMSTELRHDPRFNITLSDDLEEANPTTQEELFNNLSQDEAKEEEGPQEEAPASDFQKAIIRIFESDSYNILVALDHLGTSSTQDFLFLEQSDFEDKDCQLTRVQIRKLIAMQQWYSSHHEPTDITWISLTPNILDYFRKTYTVTNISGGPPTTPTTPMLNDHSLYTKSMADQAAEFKKATKRCQTHYAVLKDDNTFSSWNRGLKGTAGAHDTAEVLNPMYKPHTPQEQALFQAKNTFMYSVFLATLKTHQSINILRAHEHSMDAQAIYKELVAAYTQGATGSAKVAALEDEIGMLALDPSSWNKKTEQFFDLWNHKVLELETIRDHRVTDNEKRRWITKALRLHDLSQAILNAETMEETLTTIHGSKTTLTWHQFYRLLRNAAIKYDIAHSPTPRVPRSNNNSNRNTPRDKDKDHHDSKTKSPGFIPPEKFALLSPEERRAHIEAYQNTPEGKAKLKKKLEQRLANLSDVTVNANKASTSPPSLVKPSTPSSGNSSAPPPNNSSTRIPSATTSAPAASAAQTLLSSRNIHAQEVQVNGLKYTLTNNMANTVYRSFSSQTSTTPGALVDGGANGGLSGSDVREIARTNKRADVTGIANNDIPDIPICTVASVIQTTAGPKIGIFHQYAHHGTGRTIHSVNQLAAFGIIVDEKPKATGGQQQLTTPDGFIIPLAIRNGLAYMDMYPPSDHELATLETIIFTSDADWDPTVLDNEVPDSILQDHGTRDLPLPDQSPDDDLNIYSCIYHSHPNRPLSINRSIIPNKPNFQRLRPLFGWLPTTRIQHTLEHTTQWYRAEGRLPLRRHFKSRFPAANVARLHDTIATDTFFSDTPAHDDGILGHGGATMAQIYTGKTSQFLACYPMGSESQMASTLLAFITDHGAPDTLFSDNAKAEVNSKIQDILRNYIIKRARSEPHQQNQNIAERRIQDVKHLINAIMDRTATPSPFWLLCLEYVVYLLNHVSSAALDWKTPIEAIHGQQPDISALLHFRWWQPVYYHQPGKSFPSKSQERLGRWVGIAENQGDALTYRILDDETQAVVSRSVVRSAEEPLDFNHRTQPPDDGEPTDSKDSLEPIGESKPTPTGRIKSVTDFIPPQYKSSVIELPSFSPTELLGKHYIHTADDGCKYNARVIKKISDRDAANHEKIKFLVELGDGTYEDIVSYVELCDIIEQQEKDKEEQGDQLYCFKQIKSHQGPLQPSDSNYKGSRYNLEIEWTDGTTTFEPLHTISKDDPIECALYAKRNGLLNKPGWKRLRPFARRHFTFLREVNKAVTNGTEPKFKFGVQVPQTSKQADFLDAANGNHKWRDARNTELNQMDEYEVFIDLGKGIIPPEGYLKIKCHFVYDVKHDLRHKGRLVGGGHLTPPCKEEAYSGVISLRTLRIAITLGELNGLKIMVGDIGNAYLEAYTQEKVYIVAGPEFGELEGHTLIIQKALYGLRTSGKRFHDRLADTLLDMGFTPCKGDENLWIRPLNDYYEFVCVYVDDIMAIMEKPQQFFDDLREIYGYKLKGVGPPKYHLGGDFYRDPDGTLAWGAQSYIQRLLANYETLFKEQPKLTSAPLDHNDSPELDTSHELDKLGRTQYQSLIGALQWCITLGRIDILCAVMTLSRFRAQPRHGHLERVKRICGYLRKKPEGAIRFRTGIPNNEAHYAMKEYNWMYSVYGDCKEQIDHTAPTPKGKAVRITTFVDANLYHCKVTGKAVTAVLTFLNQTLVDWYGKKQATVETATYGSEYVAAKTATEQIIGHRFLLRQMGAPIDGPAWLLGDNESVVTSSTIPISALNKRHNALAFHLVRSNIAAGVVKFCHIPGKSNPADILSKFLPHAKLWPHVQPILFCRGDTLPRDVSPIGECQRFEVSEICDEKTGENDRRCGVSE